MQQPQLTIAFSTPANFAPGDRELDVLANVLGNGKSSRLYKRLVYDLKIAQSVSAAQDSQMLASDFEITASPMPGHTLDELLTVIDEEIAQAAAGARRRRRARARQEPDRVGHRARARAAHRARRAPAALQLPRWAIPATWPRTCGATAPSTPRRVQRAAQTYLKLERRASSSPLSPTRPPPSWEGW